MTIAPVWDRRKDGSVSREGNSKPCLGRSVIDMDSRNEIREFFATRRAKFSPKQAKENA